MHITTGLTAAPTIRVPVIDGKRMRQRYDYHSLAEQVKLISIALPVAVLFFLWLFLKQDHSRLEWVAVLALIIALVLAALLGYLRLAFTVVEISEAGIRYQTFGRRIFSPWENVRKIKAVGRSYRIYTDKGNFFVGWVEPAETESQSGIEIVTTERSASRDLIDTIKKFAPHVQFVYSILNRPL